MQGLIKKLVKKYKTNCPYTIASYLNIIIKHHDLPEGVNGFYFRTLRRRFISISTNIPEHMQRFTCAHELGHDRLHKSMGYYFIEQNTLFKPGKFERQANDFAIKLLTHSEEISECESLEHYYKRLGIPKCMIKL